MLKILIWLLLRTYSQLVKFCAETRLLFVLCQSLNGHNLLKSVMLLVTIWGQHQNNLLVLGFLIDVIKYVYVCLRLVFVHVLVDFLSECGAQSGCVLRGHYYFFHFLIMFHVQWTVSPYYCAFIVSTKILY